MVIREPRGGPGEGDRGPCAATAAHSGRGIEIPVIDRLYAARDPTPSASQISVIWQRSARKALNSWDVIILDVALLTVLSIALGASQASGCCMAVVRLLHGTSNFVVAYEFEAGPAVAWGRRKRHTLRGLTPFVMLDL